MKFTVLPLWVLLLIGVAGRADAQLSVELRETGANPVDIAATITADDLRRHLTILASDEMEGRETGQPGQKKAAAYLADYFRQLGLPAIGAQDGYFQPISFVAEGWETIELALNGEPVRHLWEFYSYPDRNRNLPEFSTDEVLFLGYGIDSERYNDYDRVDVSGKTLLVLTGEPRDQDGNSLVTGEPILSEWSLDGTKKLAAAKRHGAELVIFIDGDFKDNVGVARKAILDNRLRMGQADAGQEERVNSIYVSPEVARNMLGKSYKQVVKSRRKLVRSGKLKPVTVPVALQLRQQKSVRQLLGENVLGFIEGSDPVLKNEVLVVTAHYDHIGMRGEDIFNGADDNGSGTSTILELAEAFTLAKQRGQGPRRSVLFMLVSGEEKGLLGSAYYVNHPIFPLERTIANINVDMVGRVDERHAENPDYIYVIGSDRLSTDLHRINETANERYVGLELDYTYNAESDPNRYYYRSDHYNFAERGIPAIFFFNGTHADYHRASDTVDKINFQKMAKIGQLVFHTAWELANRDDRIKVDVIAKP
jgi:hypothetical protein